MGQRAPDEGTVAIGKKVVFNYIDQTRMQLEGTGTVMAEVAGKGDIVIFGEQKLNARSYLRRFLFGDDRVKEPVSKLSGGERARLMLAKVLCRGGNVLILDEPTNDLDLPSLRMLEEALVDFDGAVLVVSHDRYFLDRICDQVVAFEESGLVVGPGNYSYYLEKRRERETRARQWAASPPEERKGTAPSAGKPAARPRKLSFKEQRELDGMEEAIMVAEARVTELDALIHDPEFYSTRAKEVPAIVAQLDTAKADVARLYARWAELGEISK